MTNICSVMVNNRGCYLLYDTAYSSIRHIQLGLASASISYHAMTQILATGIQRVLTLINNGW